MMKRINRYAASRIPIELDYKYQLYKLRMNSMLYKLQRASKITIIKHKKLDVVPILLDGLLELKCNSCTHLFPTQNIDMFKHTYVMCPECKTKNRIISKELITYYTAFEPEIYHFLCRLKEVRRQAKKNKKQQKDDREPMITILTIKDISGKEKETIVTKITKELLEAKDITDNERNVAIQFQMPVDRLKLLRTLGVSFDLLNDCLTNPTKIQNQLKEDLANLYNRKGRRKK